MGKKSENRQHRFEQWLAEISDRFEDVAIRAQQDGDAFAAARAECEADARSTSVRLDEVRAELEQAHTAVAELRATLHARLSDLDSEIRASVTEIDARSGRSLAAFEESLGALRDRAVVQVDERSDSFDAQLSSGLAEILSSASQEVEEARAEARRCIDDAVASVQHRAREAQDDLAPVPPEPTIPTVPMEPPVLTEVTDTTEFTVRSEPSLPNDDDFFGQLAAELRDAVDPLEFPTGPEPTPLHPVAAEDTPPATVEAPTAVITATKSQPHNDAIAARAARRPVQVGVSLAALTASTEVLTRSAADGRVRVEVIHVAVGGRATSFLRLTAYNVAGWWEYHDVPARTDSKEPQSAVVDLGELANALASARHAADESEVVVQMAGNLTIGNVLLLDQPGSDPVLPYHRQRIEHVDLRVADRSGLSVETQIGLVSIPPRLISFLRTRNYRTSEILMIEDWPCLAAQIASSTEGTVATIVTRLGEPGVPLDEAAEERRNAAGSEVVQLIRALSADTTPEELAQILRTGVGYARRRAAAHPALPPALIENLIDHGTEAMRAAAASNPGASQAGCALAAADGSEIVRAAVAANPAVTDECLALLTADPVPQVREHAAANARCTRELLARLAEDADSLVRAAAAAHPDQEPEILSVLAHDADPRVCGAVASNPACPAELLGELLALVPDAVLANPAAPASVLAAGSRVDARQLRTVVAANPSTPAKQLQSLGRDADPDVVRAVAENPATPANVRRKARRRLNSVGTDHTD